MSKRAPEALFIGISLFIGLIGGLITKLGMPAYEMVQKPWFTPPQWAFPVVWTVLYILMGYGMAQVWKAAPRNLTRCLLTFGGQLVLNFFWTVWFFLLQWYGFAFGWLILLLAGVLMMDFGFYNAVPVAGLLQLPYVVWLLLAGALNYGVWMMNS